MGEPRITRVRPADEPRRRQIVPRALTLTSGMYAQPLHPITNRPWECPVQLTDGCRLFWNEGWDEPAGKQTVVCDGVVIKGGRSTTLFFTSTFPVDRDELYRRLGGGA